MEINRAVLKKKAKDALHGIYFFMFLACVLAGIVGASEGGMGFSLNLGINQTAGQTSAVIGGYDSQTQARPEGPANPIQAMLDERLEKATTIGEAFSAVKDAVSAAINEYNANPWRKFTFAAIAVGVIVAYIFALAFSIFVSGPASVSFAKAKLSAVLYQEPTPGDAFFAFKNNYGGILKATLLRSVYLWLWGLLPILAFPLMVSAAGMIMINRVGEGYYLILFSILAVILLSIPAMVKSYQYMMVPYILADNPHIGARAALRRSTNIMHGFKWQTFVLHLSFIGWYILGAMLCGIGVLFVDPYYQATMTLLYDELSRKSSEPELIPAES